MSATKKPTGGNLLLWVGLAMVVSSFALTVVGSVYVGRAPGYSSPGGMMGPGGIMVQQGYGAPGWGAAGEVGSLPKAREAVEQALRGYGNPDLEVAEVMEFSNNYYAEVREKDTGTGAMELLVEQGTGQVYPEPGPNIMWNAKYGMMSGSGMGGGMMGGNSPGMRGAPSFRQNSEPAAAGEMPISPGRAREIANDYLERVSPGTEAGEAEEFYGYYTLHTERDGEITGMLSVDGYSGEAWYHSWHGAFIAMEESEEGP